MSKPNYIHRSTLLAMIRAELGSCPELGWKATHQDAVISLNVALEIGVARRRAKGTIEVVADSLVAMLTAVMEAPEPSL